jgi:RNA-directed DNA polymerase
VSKTTFSKIDHILTNQLKRWSYRRHTNKSRRWIKDKYFIKVGNRDWIFGFKHKDGENDAIFTLMKLADIPIRRHIKVRCEANPYDPTWDAYFWKRKQKSNRTRTSRKGTLSEIVSCKGADEPI